METPADVLIYVDQIAGEAKRGRLIAIGNGFYEVTLQTAGGPRRTLMPISRTFIVSVETEEAAESSVDVER